MADAFRSPGLRRPDGLFRPQSREAAVSLVLRL